jgi:hypothetical protein
MHEDRVAFGIRWTAICPVETARLEIQKIINFFGVLILWITAAYRL